MDETWEKAVEAAFNGETDVESVRTLTLDGAVKCVNGRLPQPSILEKYYNIQHLSMANIGVSSLEKFPRLKNLQKLILSDNRIAGGLEFLVEAGLQSLSDLDLSNNRISDIDDLKPLAELRLVSLDLYECPVTRVRDYRCRVFGMIKSLKYLDKMDAEENERPESDDEEEEDEEEEEEEEEEEDGLSGEIDGEDRKFKPVNGVRSGSDGVVDVDEDERSDTDEEGCETSNGVCNSNQHSNGFKENAEDAAEAVYDDEDEGDDEDGEYGAEEEDEEEEDERVMVYPLSARQLETEDEIDGHDQMEDEDDDDDGETDEEVPVFEVDGDFDDEEAKDELEDDNGSRYLVQPIGQVEIDDGAVGIRDSEDPESDDDAEDDDEDDKDGEVQETSHKRKREDEENVEVDDDYDDSDDDEDDDEEEEDESSGDDAAV